MITVSKHKEGSLRNESWFGNGGENKQKRIEHETWSLDSCGSQTTNDSIISWKVKILYLTRLEIDKF